MATMQDLPAELQAKIWLLFFRSCSNSHAGLLRMTTIRLVSKLLSTQCFGTLCIWTFLAEMDRRKANRAKWTHDLMSSAVFVQAGQDTVVKKLYMAMALDTDGKSAFTGLKVLARMYDHEETLLRKCATRLERGESLDGIIN